MAGTPARVKDVLLEHVSRDIKQLQSLQSDMSTSVDMVTNTNRCVQSLCEHLDHILMHGLREFGSGYWPFVQYFTRTEAVQSVKEMRNVRMDIGRGRAWLYVALNEQSVESYVRMFTENQAITQNYYLRESFLRDIEVLIDKDLGQVTVNRLIILQTLVAGLDYISFDLTTDCDYLDHAASEPSSRLGISGVAQLTPDIQPSFVCSVEARFKSNTETSRQGGSVPTETSRQAGSVHTETSRQAGSIHTETSRQGDSVPTETSRQAGSVPTETSRQAGSVPTETSRQGDSVPTETSRQAGSVTNETSRQVGSVTNETSRQAGSVPTDTSRQVGSVPTEIASVRDEEPVPRDVKTNPSNLSSFLDRMSSEQTAKEDEEDLVIRVSKQKKTNKQKRKKKKRTKDMPGDGSRTRSNAVSFVPGLGEDNVDGATSKSGPTCADSPHFTDQLPPSEEQTLSVSPDLTVNQLLLTEAIHNKSAVENSSLSTPELQAGSPCVDSGGSPLLTHSPCADSGGSPLLTHSPCADSGGSPLLTHSPCADGGGSPLLTHSPCADSRGSPLQAHSPCADSGGSPLQTQSPCTDSRESPSQAHLSKLIAPHSDNDLEMLSTDESINKQQGSRRMSDSRSHIVYEGTPRRPLAISNNDKVDADVKIDENTRLVFSLDVLFDEGEEAHRLVQVATPSGIGLQRNAYILITNNAVYILRKDGIEGIYSREIGIRYSQFEHIVIGLGWQSLILVYSLGTPDVTQSLGGMASGLVSEKTVLLTGREAVSRGIVESVCICAAQCPGFLRSIPLNRDDDTRVEAIEKELIKLGSHTSMDIVQYSLVNWEQVRGEPPPSVAKTTEGPASSSGHLLVKSTNMLGMPIWKQSFFKLKRGKLYQYANEGDSVPKHIYTIHNCGGCTRVTGEGKPFTISVLDKEGGSLVIAAVSEEELTHWLQALCEAVIGKQVKGSPRHHRTCLNCALLLTQDKLHILLEDWVNESVQLVASCDVTDVNDISVDNTLPLYCTVAYDHGSSQGLWLICFSSEYELGRFESALATTWEEEFQIRLVLGQVQDNEIRRRAHRAVELMQNSRYRSDSVTRGRSEFTYSAAF